MDLSKTTLKDLDVNKADKLINENKKQDINHKSVQEQSSNYDFKKFSNYREVESNDDKQSAIHLNYNQLKLMEIQNSQSKSDDATERSITISSKLNDLSKINENPKVQEMSNLEDELNKSSLLCSKLNSCDKKFIVNESNNENILKSADVSIFLEKTDKNVEEVADFQKEIKKPEVPDEVETIEKIAEMIGISEKDTDENNTKTKKQLQLLMSKNQYLQTSNSLDENSASCSYIETTNRPLKINSDDADQKIKHMNEKERNKKRKFVPDSPKKVHDFQIGTPKIKCNDISEQNVLEKSGFEEIEDKLEEMFAGIEDEKLVNTTPDDKNMPKKSNVSLEKYVKVDDVSTDADYNTRLLLKDGCDTYISNKSPLPTKAAKKSTTSLSNAENMKQLNLLLRDHNNPSIPKSMFYLKTVPPRRRLSIGINKDLFKHSVKTKDEMVEKKGASNREECKNPLPLNLPNHKEVKQIRKNVLTNKIKNNNQKKHSKYKKELTYIKTNNCSNKKIIRKSEASIKAKQSRQKIKHPRMQRLLFSENDTEEKQLQTKDIETKNRSPYILIKNNGNIAVVNTVTPDDYNEKFTRSKKSSNCVYERKTVKGCHSSTLSNRYDADTADSSWKCVFCKIGPHKKGLGDLFGPYIISSDCDEYRSIKDSLEKFQKLRRNDLQLLNFPNKSVKFIGETSNSHIRNISECNYEHLINIYALGMSQVSADCYEIWVHEECAIWAPNIFVVGSRLAGLEEATWNSVRYECVYCLKQGALLCCLQRDCKTTSHVPCAREFKWLLNESKFWVYCSKHALQKHLCK